ncbi:MAG: hypothetical protein ACKOE2_09915 [Actinomycetales bacterium]
MRCIACGVGPGPYTGLRVGVATATALGLAWQVPVHGVCSLDALAARPRGPGPRRAVGHRRVRRRPGCVRRPPGPPR